MIIYIPRLIESAGQADALPEGTIAVDGENPAPYFKFGNRWIWGADGGLAPRTPAGLTALVPIEAEEETREHPRRHETTPRPGEFYLRLATMTRHVTPWEPQQ